MSEHAYTTNAALKGMIRLQQKPTGSQAGKHIPSHVGAKVAFIPRASIRLWGFLLQERLRCIERITHNILSDVKFEVFPENRTPIKHA